MGQDPPGSTAAAASRSKREPDDNKKETRNYAAAAAASGVKEPNFTFEGTFVLKPKTHLGRSDDDSNDKPKEPNVPTLTDEDKKEHDSLLQRAEQGDGAAMALLGNHCSTGSKGFPRDPKLAFGWYVKADAAGNLWGTVMVGVWLTTEGINEGIGLNLANPQQEGMMHVAMAARGGSFFGAYLMGMAYASGRHGVTKDKQKALRWLKACLSEGVQGCHALSKAKKEEAQQTIDEILLSKAD